MTELLYTLATSSLTDPIDQQLNLDEQAPMWSTLDAEEVQRLLETLAPVTEDFD